MAEDKILRIAIVGTESTGKSSLAAALAGFWNEPWASEFVREYWEERQGRIEAADLELIARGQIHNENAAVSAARRLVFCDTTLLMNVCWADDLFPGQLPDWVRRTYEETVHDYALYLFCEADIAWEPDPQRVYAEPVSWQASSARVRAMLDEMEVPYVAITGEGRQRLDAAINAIKPLLAGMT